MTSNHRVIAIRAIVELGLFSLVSNLLVLVMPLYLLQVYERVLPSSSLETLIYLSMFAVVAIIIHGCMEAIRSHYASRVATRFELGLASGALQQSMVAGSPEKGDIQKLRDLAQMRNFLSSKLLLALFDVPFFPLFLLILFFIHPVLFWITLFGVVVLCLIAALAQAATAKKQEEAFQASGAAMANAQAMVQQSEVAKALGMKGNLESWWGETYAKSLELNDVVARLNSWFGGLSKVVRTILQVTILGVGAYLVLLEEMTAGMIFASSIIAGRALQPIDQIIGGWKQLNDGIACMRRVLSTHQAETEDPDFHALAPTGKVDVDGLFYMAPGAMPGAEPLLKKISFKVPAGQMIALVGPSGAGKSTLLRLIVGAISPDQGSVRIDDATIESWNPTKLGKLIGYLPQDVDFLPGTIGHNISRFEPDIDTEAIQLATSAAQATDVVLRMPMGFSTPVGPGGVRLSGGERQRLGLARAFFGAPKLIVLDEPNAHLDGEGDRALLKALEDMRDAGSTIIVSTHKLAFASKFDGVMVLENGLIKAFGPPEQVLGPRNAPPPRKATPTQPVTSDVNPSNDAAKASDPADPVQQLLKSAL